MKIVFASNNENKIKEIQEMLPAHIKIISLKEIGCLEEIPETATTIEGNAILKANYITQKYGYPCFADDSGLEVTALKGEPGVHSARYAGEEKNEQKNTEKLLHNLQEHHNRDACFKTVICLNFNNKQHLFTGIIQGNITTKPIGTNGFGYDPVFIPKQHTETFAQMSIKKKSEISHRAKAVQQLVEYLLKK